jgi:hypothetical protein
VPEAPDPLGRRALFWAPAERHEDDPSHPDASPDRGRHALYSDPGRAAVRRDKTQPPVADVAPRGRASHPSNRRASAGAAPGSPLPSGRAPRPSPPLDDLERPAVSGMFGTLTLQCSSCRVRSQVDLVEYIVLHLPLWFWRPGRGYTRFMTCPACRRRTWISASWSS